MPTLKDLKEKFAADQKKLTDVFAEAKNEKGEYDFAKVKSLGEGTTGEKLEKVRAMEVDLEKDWDAIEKQAKAEESFKAIQGREGEPARPMRHPDGGGRQFKTWGQLLVESESFKKHKESGGKISVASTIQAGIAELKLEGYLSPYELKTLFETGAGWAPESVRLPGFVEKAAVQPNVIDIIPSGRTSQASVVYMEETTRTHNAAEKAEGATYAESAFALTQQSMPVSKITDSVPVTDEQLEDVAQAESYLGDRLRFGLRQRASSQCLVGNGVAPNIKGILNFSGVQSQAKGADPNPDAIYKAITKVLVTGGATPTHVVLHPNDWESIRLLRTADGVYIWGNPSEAGPERIWGLPVIKTAEETENTGLVGSFLAAYIMLFDRRGVDVQVGFTGTQFVEGKKTIRADMRAVLVGFRGAAFCKVTGI